jgi:hypothetical protein
MQSVNFSKHALYRTLTKREKAFINIWIGKLKDEWRSHELEQEFFVNVDLPTNKFVHKDQIIQLFFQSDEAGSVPDKLDDKQFSKEDLVKLQTAAMPKEKKVKAQATKDVYGRGAYKRWQKASMIFHEGTSQFIVLQRVRYQIMVEGKKFRLVVPGQTQLSLTKKGK